VEEAFSEGGADMQGRKRSYLLQCAKTLPRTQAAASAWVTVFGRRIMNSVPSSSDRTSSSRPP